MSEYDQAAKYIAQIEALQAQVATLNARLNEVRVSRKLVIAVMALAMLQTVIVVLEGVFK